MVKNGFVKVSCITPELLVGNPMYNVKEMLRVLNDIKSSIIVFPELCVTGYTCGDLFFQNSLLNDVNKAILFFLDNNPSEGIVAIGAPIELNGSLFNSAIICKRHEILGIVPKRSLPNSKEFYEKRWFKSSAYENATSINFLGKTYPFGELIFTDSYHDLHIGVEICEDMWATVTPGNLLAMAGANVILNLSASNETLGKSEIRRNTVLENSRRNSGAYIYASAGVNESTTDTVYSGHNIIAENGTMLVETENFSPISEVISADIDLGMINYKRRINTNLHDDIGIKANPQRINFTLNESAEYHFETLFDRTTFIPKDTPFQAFEKIAALQEYALFKRLKHTNAKSLVIGVSGGLDSTLALLVAYQAFKKLNYDMKNIIAVTMPGLGTTDRTKNNALGMMERLGLTILEKPINASVIEHFKLIDHDPDIHDVTYENTQARIRTLILMDLANMHNGLVLGTGDMSEIALGWCTYNGDQMSMYGINCGIPKTLVKFMVEYYARYRFKEIEDLLMDVVNTPITPELIKGQQTENLIGKYEVNDFILNRYLSCGDDEERIKYILGIAFKELSIADINKYTDNFFIRFFTQQFKRQASPDGPKILDFGLSARADYRIPSDIKRW